MDHLNDRLENLRFQIEKLKLTFSQLNTDNEALQSENKELRERITLREAKIKALNEEKSLIIHAKSLTDAGMSSKDARHKINELIRGIDKCIAQLNQ
jgi:regulator of replication initiation timing